MRAGELNEPLYCFQRPQTSPDTDGFLEALTPRQIWGQVEALQSLGDGTMTEQYRVRARLHPQVSLQMILHWEGLELHVTGVQKFPNHDRMELLCEATEP